MAETAEPEKLVELEKVQDPEAGNPEPEAGGPPEAGAPPPAPSQAVDASVWADVVLRVLFFASTLTALVVIVTADQTNLAPSASPRPAPSVAAKFENSPALIYFVTALSVAGLYSIITALASISVILAPNFAADFFLFFVVSDVVMLGIIASATGAAGTIGYIGLNGDSHANWGQVCNIYDTFCQHIASATALSLFAAIVLIGLIILSVVNLQKKIPK